MPPKAKRSKPSGSPFLFVNEDAKSVTRAGKDAELDREKQSHVQRQNFARKRRLRGQGSLTSGEQAGLSPSLSAAGPANILAHQNSVTFSQTFEPETTYHQLDFQPLKAETQPADAINNLLDAPFPPTSFAETDLSYIDQTFGFTPAYQPDHAFDYATTSPNQSGLMQGTFLNHPLHSYVPNNYFPTNPFASTQGLLEKWAPPLIQHYTTRILPEQFFADVMAVPLGRIRHAPAIHADMQAVMSEPAHLYSFLASASAQMLAREGRLLLPDMPSHDHYRVPMFFKTKAIKALRPKLAIGMIDHGMVMDVFRLMAVEVFLENYDAAESHLQALQSMMVNLGGRETLGTYFVEKSTLMDLYGALKRLKKPSLPLVWDPGSDLPDITVTMELLKLPADPLGTRFRALVNTIWVRTSLVDAFNDLIEFTSMEKWIRDQAEYNAEHYRWLTFRRAAIAHRLLELPPGHSNQEECFRIALIFYIALTTSPEAGRRCASNQVQSLQIQLEASDLSGLWRPHTDWLLWITIIGGLSARGTQQEKWFSGLASKASKEMGITEIGGLEEVLSGFLYDPLLQHDALVGFCAPIYSK